MARLRITHARTGAVIAEGPKGWGITPFEGNYYVAKRYLKTDRFRTTWVPGLCIYKFLYVWLDYVPKGAPVERALAWKYWLPNPLLPFIWFRVALPGNHPALAIELLQDTSS